VGDHFTQGESAAIAVLGIAENVRKGATSAEAGRELTHNITQRLSPEAKTVADRIVDARTP
jgi:hypothetical protein